MSETTIETRCGGCGEVTEELVWWVKFAMWLCPDCDAEEREDGDTRAAAINSAGVISISMIGTMKCRVTGFEPELSTEVRCSSASHPFT